MPNGGTLSIRTANVTIGETMSFGQVLMPSGEYVTIEVEDTGIGIAPGEKVPICCWALGKLG